MDYTDHSVQAYLGRRTTQTLLLWLRSYSSEAMLPGYYQSVIIMVDILKSREEPIPQDILDRITDFENSEQTATVQQTGIH